MKLYSEGDRVTVRDSSGQPFEGWVEMGLADGSAMALRLTCRDAVFSLCVVADGDGYRNMDTGQPVAIEPRGAAF